MHLIWNLHSQPELAALSKQERQSLILQAGETNDVRRSSRIGLLFGGLCARARSWIGDSFDIGIYGAGIGGSVGGLAYSQGRLRAILTWIRTRNATLMVDQNEHLTPSSTAYASSVPPQR